MNRTLCGEMHSAPFAPFPLIPNILSRTPLHPHPEPRRLSGRPPAGALLAATLLALAIHFALLGGSPDRAKASSAAAPQALATMEVRAVPMPVPHAPEQRSPVDVDADALANGQGDRPDPPPARRHDRVTVATSDPVRAAPVKRTVNVMPVVWDAATAPGSASDRTGARLQTQESADVPIDPEAPSIALLAQADSPVAASDAATASPSASTSAAHSPGASAAASAAAAPAPSASAPVPLRYPERSIPTYKTKIPPAFSVEYEIRRGILAGNGELSWRPSGARYEAQLKVGIAGLVLLTQISEGGFDAAGVAPMRYTDQRMRKAARAANFQREAGKITYSGPKDEFALPAGTQDRLSWMIQLASILSADPKLASPGAEVMLYVSGARADVSIWTLRYIGAETLETPAGPLHTVKFSHLPRSPTDVHSEVWLDPARHHLPVRARLTQGDQDEGLDLLLRRVNGLP